MSTGNTGNGLTGTSKLSQKRNVSQKKNFIRNNLNTLHRNRGFRKFQGQKTGKIYDFVRTI